MLVADRAQALGFFGLCIALDILIADPDAGMTPDVVVDAGHRDAAFLTGRIISGEAQMISELT